MPPGKTGGVVSYTQFNGARYRSLVKPIGDRTGSSASIAHLDSMLYTRFASTLTAPQQAQWNYWAAYNPYVLRTEQSTYLSGRTFYVRCNRCRLHAGLAVVDALPTLGAFTGAIGATLAVSVATVTCTTVLPVPGYTDVCEAQLFWLEPPQNRTPPWDTANKRFVGFTLLHAPYTITFPNPWPCIAGQRTLWRAAVCASAADPLTGSPFLLGGTSVIISP